MAFSTGKYAKALCDRCGREYPYLSLLEEWTGFRVCDTCYEPKHPQLTPPQITMDPQALRDARPDRQESMDIFVGRTGWGDGKREKIFGTMILGRVSVVIT
jgi:hypothetical protein